MVVEVVGECAVRSSFRVSTVAEIVPFMRVQLLPQLALRAHHVECLEQKRAQPMLRRHQRSPDRCVDRIEISAQRRQCFINNRAERTQRMPREGRLGLRTLISFVGVRLLVAHWRSARLRHQEDSRVSLWISCCPSDSFLTLAP